MIKKLMVSFLLLTRMERISDPIKIKMGHATSIMKLVGKLKEKQGQQL